MLLTSSSEDEYTPGSGWVNGGEYYCPSGKKYMVSDLGENCKRLAGQGG